MIQINKNINLCILNVNATKTKLGTNSNNTECINIANILNNVENVNCDVINITDEELDKDLFKDMKFNNVRVDLANPEKYDAILFMNSTPNFFGGLENQDIVNKYRFLAKCKCPIFYLFNDRALTFMQLWPAIQKRTWNIDTEDTIKIKSDIHLVSQFSDIEECIKINNKFNDIKDGRFIDFGCWRLDNYESLFTENQGVYDLIYGGSFRSGRREEKYKDYLYDKDLNVAIYGTMKPSNFKGMEDHKAPETWLGKVNCLDVIKTNSLGFATVIVGERGFNNNIHTIRMYESILANTITFIDNDLDSQHTIYEDDFLYVHNGKELEEKIKVLKEDKVLYNRCIEIQKQFLIRKSTIDWVGDLLNYILEVL